MRVAESRSRRVSGLLQLLHSTYLQRRPHSEFLIFVMHSHRQ